MVHGISSIIARSIVAKYPTFISLYRAYEKVKDEGDRETMLSNLKIESGFGSLLNLTVKDKSMQLLDRLCIKGKEDIESLSDEILDALKVETIKLLNITDTNLQSRYHLIGVMATLATYLLPRGIATNRFTDEEYRSFMPNILSELKQLDGITHCDSNEKIVVKFARIYNSMFREPEWTEELAKPIIESLLELLDRNREMGFASKRTYSMVCNYMIDIVNHGTTDSNLERMIAHLFECLSQVEDGSLEDWANFPLISGIPNLNYYKEEDIGINMTYNKSDKFSDDLDIRQLVSALGERLELSIIKHINTMLNSQQWKDRYTTLIGLAKTYTFFQGSFKQHYPIILKKSVLTTLVDDENIKVRWASLQCLIGFGRHNAWVDEFVESRDEIFQVIIKSASDPNECIQTSCCFLIQSMTDSIQKMDDNVLEELSRFF
ncbi:hypothetical protein DFA_07793 [Cavenderia fasciculata]|uniref:HEAT repeat-containing protein n=1 Tax=Cavenderia fasciculata TaxID=261658 RepID=F4Q3E6_CACFS|nr:uncharacterized protein DFA_07793 [Cavenderia fasciculata]EGG16815.1 hypothetical protein DFA_07793 [Cavenderia fasciculata]|eukprot:XP_004355289.1 hypothetical protein DFA_07793 [Cavenderia fasciculata]